MKSNELLRLYSADGGEDYEFKPNDDIIPPKGKFYLWGDVHVTDNNENTICHLRVINFKGGAELPSVMFPKAKPKAKKVEDDLL